MRAGSAPARRAILTRRDRSCLRATRLTGRPTVLNNGQGAHPPRRIAMNEESPTIAETSPPTAPVPPPGGPGHAWIGLLVGGVIVAAALAFAAWRIMSRPGAPSLKE